MGCVCLKNVCSRFYMRSRPQSSKLVLNFVPAVMTLFEIHLLFLM